MNSKYLNWMNTEKSRLMLYLMYQDIPYIKYDSIDGCDIDDYTYIVMYDTSLPFTNYASDVDNHVNDMIDSISYNLVATPEDCLDFEPEPEYLSLAKYVTDHYEIELSPVSIGDESVCIKFTIKNNKTFNDLKNEYEDEIDDQDYSYLPPVHIESPDSLFHDLNKKHVWMTKEVYDS